MAVLEISKPEELRALIESGKPLLVMFSADWCGDCKELYPHFEKNSGKLEESGVTVVRVVLSKEKETEGKKKPIYLSPEHFALKEEFSKFGFPTVVFFKDGRVFSSTLEDTEASFKKLIDYVISRVKSEVACTSGCSVSGDTGNRTSGDVRRFWRPRENQELGAGKIHPDSRFRGRQPVI